MLENISTCHVRVGTIRGIQYMPILIVYRNSVGPVLSNFWLVLYNTLTKKTEAYSHYVVPFLSVLYPLP